MSVYMFNKPAGFITSCRDPRDRTVMEFIPDRLREKIHPVGRLDRDTTGLLLFTDDGRVDRALLDPGNGIPRVYSLHAIGSMTEEKIAAIASGVMLGDSGVRSRGASLRVTGLYTVYELRDLLPPRRRMRYLKNPEGPAFSAEIELAEGRKHEVKLIMRASDCRVIELRRISFGGIRLDRSLEPGGLRELDGEEYRYVNSLLSGPEVKHR
ncbi:MAG: pseudouridine synthase [Clostridia bacterium]|nr:pseudouridine synthase [Clostridia bacterium]